MSFDDVAAQLKTLKAKQQQAQPTQDTPVDLEEMYAIRARMLGVLIRDARDASGFDVPELATALDVRPQTLQNWEYGRATPSLPQIELLAYVLQVPISHFWGTETFAKQREGRTIDGQEYATVRDRMIGLLIRAARDEKNLTLEDLAARLQIDATTLNAYENGRQPVPMPVMVSLASVLNVNLSYFLDHSGRVGEFLEIQEALEVFARMPDDVREFVSIPANQVYIQVAMALADIPTDNLRKLAESLLDITL